MEYIHMEHPNFDYERFRDEVFNNGSRDPFNERLTDIKEYRDLQGYFGLAPVHVDERSLRDGFMSQKLYEALVHKLGKERLDSYFVPRQAPKKTKEQQDDEDLLTMMFGTVRDYSRLNLHRLGKGKIK